MVGGHPLALNLGNADDYNEGSGWAGLRGDN
jgi:hypothetical protein